jgi:hypothetical protein
MGQFDSDFSADAFGVLNVTTLTPASITVRAFFDPSNGNATYKCVAGSDVPYIALALRNATSSEQIVYVRTPTQANVPITMQPGQLYNVQVLEFIKLNSTATALEIFAR